MTRARPEKPADPVAVARKTMLEGVGDEVSASFPGITRLGGQIVAALYLSEAPQSMDTLAAELGRSKSNIFGNLRGLQAAGIVQRHHPAGTVPGTGATRTRFDTFSLRGKYPDVIIGAYLARLRRVVTDKQQLCARTLEILGGARGAEADALRRRVVSLGRKYDRFGVLFSDLLPAFEGPLDLEAILEALPAPILTALGSVARRTMGLFAREPPRSRRTKR